MVRVHSLPFTLVENAHPIIGQVDKSWLATRPDKIHCGMMAWESYLARLLRTGKGLEDNLTIRAFEMD